MQADRALGFYLERGVAPPLEVQDLYPTLSGVSTRVFASIELFSKGNIKSLTGLSESSCRASIGDDLSKIMYLFDFYDL